MGDSSPELFAAVFDDDGRAERAERDLDEAERRGLIGLLAVAVVARAADGGASWSVRGAGIRHLAARAETIATVTGVLLPADLLVTGLAVAAGVADDEPDGEFGERFARELAHALPPGSSALVGVIEDRWATEVQEGLRGYHRLTRGAP